MKTFLASCQELAFPSFCLGCQRRLPWRRLPLFCDDCLSGITAISSPRCLCCGAPFATGEDHLCGACLQRDFSFDLARAALAYQPPITGLISALKFQGQLSGLASLAALARASRGFQELSAPDLILPVPLHPQRLRERGYNQALLLARACFPERRALIHPGVLLRHRATVPQTALSGTLRRKNLSGAFSLIQPHMVNNRKILLVDDVFTTGSTVDVCARILSRAGAARVEIFTLAKTF
ncbi:MAG TPA: amidophosphoribosyltransferase [Desulfobulbaceae bacterium]|nr:amidophosphoribosyltransferase [Desulfobulbaceae bacterium]